MSPFVVGVLPVGTCVPGSRSGHGRSPLPRSPMRALPVLGDGDRDGCARGRDGECRERRPTPSRPDTSRCGATHRRCASREPAGHDRQRVAALEAVLLIDRARGAAARAGSVSRRDREPAVTGREVVTASAPARSPSARRPCRPSERPQFGQKLDRRRIGVPHSQRATRCEPCRSSSISPRRASMPTTIAARSCSRSSRNPPRRYISTSSPPRSRSVSSRALSSVRRSRRSTPACARRGATPAAPLARRRNNDTRLECSCPLGGGLRAGSRRDALPSSRGRPRRDPRACSRNP